ncbi:MAG: PKD domain-containing protein [Thermoplasmatales archaeon]|nr:MAG: PKD domain-containing protein [Thermoplasmatales archaeon]
MTKKLVYLLVCMLLFSIFTGAIPSKSFREVIDDPEYTHTVFAGVAFAQGSGPCHKWNQNISNAYVSGDYDFEYASMIVYDKYGDVLNREAYDWDSNYSITSYPTSIFDGDYKRIVGNHPEDLPDALNASGNRTVSNITVNITLSWLGNATINVTITVQNNEATQYNGHIRAFITEIISRYKTSEGDPFHFGFLGFAINENFSINASDVYISNAIWNGNNHEDEHGKDFGDISPHNLQVVTAIYNSSNGYVDETVVERIANNPPYEPSDPYPANGSTAVDVFVDLSWKGGDIDDDPVTYNVFFGTNSTPPKVVDNKTGTIYDPGILNASTTYYWRIIAWDNLNASAIGPIWHFTTRKNSPPDTPEQPSGPNNGTAGFEYTFSTRSTDLDNDQVYYMWDWGDGNFSEWLGPYIQGVTVTASNIWNERGYFEVKVKAKDICYAESNWSDSLTIHIVKPVIEIGETTGGLFRVKTVIKNTGDGEATLVTWNINLTGGLILLGRRTSGTIESILPGEQVNITSRLIFGIGRINVMINAKTLNGPLSTKDQKGIVFLIFVMV